MTAATDHDLLDTETTPVPCAYECGRTMGDGSRCKRRVPGKGDRCAYHQRPSNHRLKHGGYSRNLPKHLRQAYLRIAQSTDLLSMESDIALMQVRCNELAGRLASGESGNRWERLQKVFAAFRAANKAQDAEGMTAALKEMDALINAGNDDERTWEQLQDSIDHKAKLQKMEWDRLHAMNAVATAEQVRVMVLLIANSVMRNVPDVMARSNIVADIRSFGVFDFGVAPPIPDDMLDEKILDDAPSAANAAPDAPVVVRLPSSANVPGAPAGNAANAPGAGDGA